MTSPDDEAQKAALHIADQTHLRSTCSGGIERHVCPLYTVAVITIRDLVGRLETELQEVRQERDAAREELAIRAELRTAPSVGECVCCLLAGLDGLPGVSSTKATTITNLVKITGLSQTFIVRSYRRQSEQSLDGKVKPAEFTVFLQYVEGNRAVKLALPAKVADVILRQREALTKQAVSRRAKAQAQARMDAGWKPTFGGKRGKRKAKAKAS